jgi:hypothetical protein
MEDSKNREQARVNGPLTNESGKTGEAGKRSKTRRAVRTVLFLAGSAIFGGLAVALWDRKALTAMRRKEEDTAAPPAWQNNEEID